jgi:hypothetical protein
MELTMENILGTGWMKNVTEDNQDCHIMHSKP